MRVPSYRVQIHPRMSKKYWAQEHFKGIQTLDGIVVNQPKRFLPLAQEAKKIAEEIRIKKINEQWAEIPREQLLNQSFNDQLNSQFKFLNN